MSKPTQFITSQSNAADYTSNAIPTNGSYEVTIDITMTAVAKVGNLYIQGTVNGDDWWNIPLDKVRGAVGATAKQFTHTDGDEAIAINTANAVIASLTLVGPPTAVRVFWDSTSGGAADGLNGWHLVKRDV